MTTTPTRAERRWQPRDSRGHYLPYGAVPTMLDPDDWDDSCTHAAPAERECEQCGRTGSQRFRTLPSDGRALPAGVMPITVCANTTACRRRRPRPAVEEAR